MKLFMSYKTNQSFIERGKAMEQNEQAYQEVSENSGVETAALAPEAMRYRRQAQAAEKELAALREAHQRQAEELARLKEEAEGKAAAAPEPAGNAGVKTQGVREIRSGSLRGLMERAAVRAAESGRRADLQEYLRVRRAYV